MAAILGSIVLVGCSSHTNQKLLRVFFTGVDRTNEAPVARSSAVDTNTPAQLAAAAAAAIPRFLHEPFSQRNCTACHVSDMSQELRANTAELCLGCHEKLIGNAKYVHAPVADGRCDLCHDAHEAPNRYLLTLKTAELCQNCHEENLLTKLPAHAVQDFTACTRCHDPHRSDEKKLARGKS